MDVIPNPLIINTSDGKAKKWLTVFDASITLAIDSSSSANIRLAEGKQIEGRVYVEMFTAMGSAGVFRTRSPKTGVGSQTTNVDLEHSINALGDYIYAEKTEQSLSLKDALQKVFGYYKGRLWTLGAVDNATETVVLDSDHESCLEAISGLMEQQAGLMFDYDFSKFPWVLNIKKRHGVVRAEGRLSRNVKSATITYDDTDLCTKVFMEGLNKSGEYGSITDEEAQKKYGVIEKVVSGANSTTVIAQQVAKAYLDKHKKPICSIEIDGIDLSTITGESLDKFTIGKLMRLALPDYGITVEENITQLVWQSVYRNPMAVRVTLSEQDDNIVKYINRTSKSVSKVSSKVSDLSVKVGKAVTSAEVKENELFLYNSKGDEVVRFSKATSLSGKWSGDENAATFTVTATPQNEILVRHLIAGAKEPQKDKNGNPIQNKNLWQYPIRTWYGVTPPQYEETGLLVKVNAQDNWQDGWDTGWDNAAGMVDLPGAIPDGRIQTVFTLKAPFKTDKGVRRQENRAFTIAIGEPPNEGQTATGYATVSVQSNNVGRINIGSWYNKGYENGYRDAGEIHADDFNNGWDAAAALSVPAPRTQAQGEAKTFVYKYPLSYQSGGQRVREQITDTLELSASSPIGATGFVSVLRDGWAIARISVGEWYTTGWDVAAGLSKAPDALTITGNSLKFTYKYPKHYEKNGSWVREQITENLELSADTPGFSGYVRVKRSNNDIARISVGNWYANGWDAAAALSVPAPRTQEPGEDKTFVYKYPKYYEKKPGQYVREQVTDTLQLSAGTPGEVGFVAVLRDGWAIARISVGNWYTSGWDTAAGLSYSPPLLPSSITGSSTTFTYKYPKHYQKAQGTWVREQITENLELKADSTPSATGFVHVTRANNDIARISIGNWFTSGWITAANLSVPAPRTQEPGEVRTFVYKYPKYYKNGSGQYVREQVTDTLTLEATGSNYIAVTRDGWAIARINVANLYKTGWDDAWAMVELPIETPASINENLIVKVPDTNVGVQSSRTYEIFEVNRNTAGLRTRTPGWVTVAQRWHGQYNAGWGAAWEQVQLPIDASTRGFITVWVPTEAVDGSSSRVYTLYPSNTDNDVEELRTTIGQNYVTVAQRRHGKYTAGWQDAWREVSLPLAADTRKYITVWTPTQAVGGQSARVYTLADNGDNEVILWTADGTESVTVAKLTHNKYNTGWDDARRKVSVPTDAYTASNSILIGYPIATVGSSGRRSYIMQDYDNNNVDLVTKVDDDYITVARFNHRKYTAGRNATTINDPTWMISPSADIIGTSNLAYFTTNAPTPPDPKTLYLSLNGGIWSGGQCIVYLNKVNSDPENRIARFVVSDPHPHSYSLYCTEAGLVPGQPRYRYVFELNSTSGPYPFEANTYYTFYRS